MQQAFEDLQKVKHENVLTEDDIRSALEAYDKEYYNFTIKDIEALTDVRIEKNKRNGRKQELHLRLARGQLAILKDAGEKSQGRPSEREQVHKWREQHPNGTKSQCKTETGLSYPTIRKWWDYQPPAASFEDGHISVKIRPSQELSDMLVEAFKDRL